MTRKGVGPGSPGYRVMPWVTGLLPRLVDDGIMPGFVSGALEAAAHIQLARAPLHRFFSFEGYGSDSSDRGELTRVAIAPCGRLHGQVMDLVRVLVVGDTPRDIEAAHAASAIAVGVATGKYTFDELGAGRCGPCRADPRRPLPGVLRGLDRPHR